MLVHLYNSFTPFFTTKVNGHHVQPGIPSVSPLDVTNGVNPRIHAHYAHLL